MDGTAESLVVLDAGLLRKVLRLVHCLQKERGSSCNFYACNGNLLKVSSLTPARLDTDRAVNTMVEYMEVPVEKTIPKIRSMLDAGALEQKSPLGFHRILVCFNTLISTISHEYILKHTAHHKKLHKKLRERMGSNYESAMHRVNSHQALFATDQDVGPTGHRRTHSENAAVSLLSSSEPSRTVYTDLKPSYNMEAPTFLPRTTLRRIDSQGLQIELASSPKQVGFARSVDLHDENGSEQAGRLLNLLDTFIRLKESTGVERALLSSILAIGQSKMQQLFLNDLILEIENQRRHVEELAKLPAGPLRNLCQDLVTLSPKLQELQMRIISGANLDLLHTDLDANQLWDVLTLYIDKLHSMELLIVEEIECCDQGMAIVQSPQSFARPEDLIRRLLRIDESVDVRSCIENMSNVDLKFLLLQSLSPQEIDQEPPSPLDVISNGATRVEDLLRELSSAPKAKEWEIDLYEIRFIRRIGQGSAGTTYLADWNDLKVAVKVASITELGLDGWRTEVQSLQKLHHPNIIRLLGSVYHPNPLTFCLVLEYCDAGDLQTALLKPTPRRFFFQVAMSIAKGMTYLNKRGVIHRDLKPSNMLMDGDVASGQYSVKLTDFGVATESVTLGDRTAETGTYRWMAPEVIRHEAYSHLADTYSFAIVMWQLITREEPFKNKSQVEAAAGVALESARPPFPEGAPRAVAELIRECWNDEPSSRPAFDQIAVRLQEVESILTEEEQAWLDAPLGHSAYKKKSIPQTHVTQLLNVPSGPASGNPEKKEKPKSGLRTLFNRKSTYF